MNPQANVIRTPAPLPAGALAAIKNQQNATWNSGDYAVVGTTLQIVGEQLCEAVDLRAGERVLDVAAGNGNASLAAARRWCAVTSTDYVPSLLDRGRERAAAEGLGLEFREADAESLPFPRGSFDVVLSTFGVMFTPDQEQAASELLRVCRPGGRIGLANWTPDGFIGQVFRTIALYVPPPPGISSPARWGKRDWIMSTFGASASSIRMELCDFVFRYRSAEHWLDVFRTFYGPMLRAYATLGAQAQASLTHDLMELIRRFNRAASGSIVVPSEYLEIVIDRS